MKQSKKKTVEYGKYGVIFLIPFFVAFFIFQFYPLLYTIFKSFLYDQRVSRYEVSTVVGLGNYTNYVFGEAGGGEFWNALFITIILWILNFIPQIVLALILAAWFTDNHNKLKGTGAYKVMMYMPNIITAATTALLFYQLFNVNGTITKTLIKAGLVNSNGFIEKGWGSLLLVAFIQFWMWYGNTMIVLIAGILGINPSLYEAAMVDGATSKQQFFKITIPLLRRLKFGQNIREDGPKTHLKKAGTPTMGGVIFILSTTIAMFIVSRSLTDKGMIALYSLIAFGFIGFLDDILKILKKQSEGLKAWQKMVLLLIVSGAFAYYSYVNLPHYIAIPFTNMELPLGVLYIPFVIFVYASMTNAVNLTDGLDGLASTVSVLVLTFFAVLTFTLKDYSLTVFSVALIAGLLGFLKYNAYPAKVFMGDTGSLAIGGAITTIAIISGNPLIIVLVGGIYVCEALSVIIQVTSFKLTGKRVFKMAPIHHHFEQCGWNEVKIVTVFSIITVLLCIIGFFAI